MQPHAFNQPYLDMVYWTLVVETKFYALTWLVIVTRQMKRVESLLTLWLASTAFAVWVPIPHWLDAVADAHVRFAVHRRLLPVSDPLARANARRLIMFAVSVALSIYWTLQYQPIHALDNAERSSR